MASVDAVGEHGDVLDALALVLVQIFIDLGFFIRALVQRDAHHAIGRGQRLGYQAGLGTLDVEVADFAEVEQALVVIGPFLHVAEIQVMREMVDEGEAEALRVAIHAGQVLKF